MATDKFKQGLIELAERLKNKDISDEEMIRFFEDNRAEFMASPTFPRVVTREELAQQLLPVGGGLYATYKPEDLDLSTKIVSTGPTYNPDAVEVAKLGPQKPWNSTIYNNPRGLAFMSCSCGGRDDSCQEDGEGIYSQFYVTEVGEAYRVKVQKE
jgi:hypothetical protein